MTTLSDNDVASGTGRLGSEDVNDEEVDEEEDGSEDSGKKGKKSKGKKKKKVGVPRAESSGISRNDVSHSLLPLTFNNNN